MKIVELKAENIKRLKAVRIRPDGSLIVIGGQNAQGKTSVLDSIMYALAGGRTIPEKPIHEGQSKASIVLDLGEYKVTRTFSAKGTQLKVEKPNGIAEASPQAILDGLVGKVAFDPLSFNRLDSKAQLEHLRQLVGIDFSELDNAREEHYQIRTNVSRELKELDIKINNTQEYPDAPGQPVSVSDLMTELTARQAVKNENDNLRQESIRLGNLIPGKLENLNELKRHINDLKKTIEDEELAYAELVNKKIESTEKVEQLTDPDIDSVRQQINAAEETNRMVASNVELKTTIHSRDALKSKTESLSDEIAEVDASKEKMLKDAKFPIENMSFDNDGVIYQGQPLKQASTAEQLRVSVAMGIAMNPELKILLIRDGSHLDEGNLKLIAEMAEQGDAQVWLERVGTGKEVSVIIEDGEVKE